MYNAEAESAFEDYLDQPEYDHAENALFSIIHQSFLAGWNAAKADGASPETLDN